MIVLNPKINFGAIAYWSFSPLLWAILMVFSPVISAVIVWGVRNEQVKRAGLIARAGHA